MKISWLEQIGHFDASAYYTFDVLTKELTVVLNTERGIKTENLDWKKYHYDIKEQIESSIKETKSKIHNNRNVIYSSKKSNNIKELEKAEKHMQKNINNLSLLENFLSSFETFNED